MGSTLLMKESNMRFYAVECYLLIIQDSVMLQDLVCSPLKKGTHVLKCINQLYRKDMKIRATQPLVKKLDYIFQRHKTVGTQNLFEDFDITDISVNVHTCTHDRNIAFYKYMRTGT